MRMGDKGDDRMQDRDWYVQADDELQGIKLYLAGHTAPPGYYREIETRRALHLEEEDILPASLDGRVACYERIYRRWQEQPQHP